MNTTEQGLSNCVSTSLPVHVSWTTRKGEHFAEAARTLAVSRQGAMIVLPREAVSVQEVKIRCCGTNKEAAARLLGKIRSEPEGHVYGVAFLEPSVDFWNIEFPPLMDTNKAKSPMFLQCASCLTSTMVCLDEIQAEVFEARRITNLPCTECKSWAIWGLADHDKTHKTERQYRSVSSIEPAPRTQNQRRHGRILARLTACVRNAVLSNEVVRVKDASRGGFRFVGSNYYEEGSCIMVAMPYTRDASNVFVPARVMWRQELPRLNKFEYGVAYSTLPEHTCTR